MNCIAVKMVPAAVKEVTSMENRSANKSDVNFSLLLDGLMSGEETVESNMEDKKKKEEDFDVSLAVMPGIIFQNSNVGIIQTSNDSSGNSEDFSRPGAARQIVSTGGMGMLTAVEENIPVFQETPELLGISNQSVAAESHEMTNQVSNPSMTVPEQGSENGYQHVITNEPENLIAESNNTGKAIIEDNLVNVINNFQSQNFSRTNETNGILLEDVNDLSNKFINLSGSGLETNSMGQGREFPSGKDSAGEISEKLADGFPDKMMTTEKSRVSYKNAVSVRVQEHMQYNNMTLEADRLSREQEEGAVLSPDDEKVTTVSEVMDTEKNAGGPDMQFNVNHYLINNENVATGPDGLNEKSHVYPEAHMTAISEQIVKYVSHSIAGGQHELVVELKPEYLGKVKIRLVSDKDGIVAKISASSEELREVLSMTSLQIQESLKSQGIELKNFELTSFGENSNNDFLDFSEKSNPQNQGDAKPSFAGYFAGKDKEAKDTLQYEDVRFGRINYLA